MSPEVSVASEIGQLKVEARSRDDGEDGKVWVRHDTAGTRLGHAVGGDGHRSAEAMEARPRRVEVSRQVAHHRSIEGIVDACEEIDAEAARGVILDLVDDLLLFRFFIMLVLVLLMLLLLYLLCFHCDELSHMVSLLYKITFSLMRRIVSQSGNSFNQTQYGKVQQKQ